MKKWALLSVSMWVAVANASWMALETSAYTGDKSEGGNIANYAMFYCTADAAETLFGGTDVDDIESYIEKNFAAAKSKATTYDSVSFSDGEYQILDYVNTAFVSSDYVAFALYGDSGYRAYGAGSAALTPYGQLVFNESTATSGSVGDWQKYDIPEPTGGLLMLFGLSALALKRKRTYEGGGA